MFDLLLAQTATPDPDKSVGTLERLISGGVPLICLAIAAVMGVLAYWQMRLRMESEKEKSELEKVYREKAEVREKQLSLDADKRLSDTKLDADKARDREMGMMKEQMSAQKESDATLAQAVRVIEANSKLLERLDRKLGG